MKKTSEQYIRKKISWEVVKHKYIERNELRGPQGSNSRKEINEEDFWQKIHEKESIKRCSKEIYKEMN